MGKKCKKKVVWKQLPLGENSSSASNTDGFSYSDALSGSFRSGYEPSWTNNHSDRHNGEEKSHGGEYSHYNNKRQNYKHSRSNRNNVHKWRRRADRPMEDGEKEQFNVDDGQTLQDEEYTKIETPRQEVIFKKKSLQRRKDPDFECTQCGDLVLEEREYDTKLTEIVQNQIHYDDSGMYMPDASNPTLAGVVVQQLYIGGPMVSIPVHYGQYVSPTLIPGDAALLTLDPSFSRIISAEEMEDVANMLPLQLDANGHPITVQVKVNANGVPVEIEPRGFQVFEGNIEEQQYLLSDSPLELENDERNFQHIEEDNGELFNICEIHTDQNTEVCNMFIDEEVETPVTRITEVEKKIQKQEKELKESEECSSDSQYATMSESSSPNTPASELSDPSDIPDQSTEPKLLVDQQCSNIQVGVDDTPETSKCDETSDAVMVELSNSEKNTEILVEAKSNLSVRPKERLSEKKKVKSNRKIELNKIELTGMSRKQRKKEAKMLKKQTQMKSSSVTPTVIIRENASPSLLAVNSPNSNNQLVSKSLRNSLAFLNSPEFSVQQYLKNQGSFQNRCKTPYMNRIDSSNLITSPLEGFGHIDLTCPSSMTNDNIMLPQIGREEFGEMPNFKSSLMRNTLFVPEIVSPREESINDEHNSVSAGCPNEFTDNLNSRSELDQANCKIVCLNSMGLTIETSEMSNVSSDKSDDNLLTKKEFLSDKAITMPSTSSEETDVTQSEDTTQYTFNTTVDEFTVIEEAENNSDISVKMEIDSSITADACVLKEISKVEDNIADSQTISESLVPIENERELTIRGNDMLPSLVEMSEVSNSNIQLDEPKVKVEFQLDSQLINNNTETSEFVISFMDSTPVIEQNLDLPEKEDDIQMGSMNETELVSEDQTNLDGALSKQGYVMVPVLTPYYSPTVFYGYPLVMQDSEDQGKYNRKKKRRFKKKFENQQQYYDANALTGNPYITTDDGFMIPIDPSQACHIHSCQYVNTAYPQQAIIDEGFESAEQTPYLPSYEIESSEVGGADSEVFGNLQNHERKEIVEVLKETPKSDSVESGDSGVSESEEYNKKTDGKMENSDTTGKEDIVKIEKHNTENQIKEKSEKKPNEKNVKLKKDNKKNRKVNTKSNKNRKPVMIIEEPDFSLPNSYPFSSKSSIPQINIAAIKNDNSKLNKNKNKKAKNKKGKQFEDVFKKENDKVDIDAEIIEDISESKYSTIADIKQNDKAIESTSENDCNNSNSDNRINDVLITSISYRTSPESEIENCNQNSDGGNCATKMAVESQNVTGNATLLPSSDHIYMDNSNDGESKDIKMEGSLLLINDKQKCRSQKNLTPFSETKKDLIHNVEVKKVTNIISNGYSSANLNITEEKVNGIGNLLSDCLSLPEISSFDDTILSLMGNGNRDPKKLEVENAENDISNKVVPLAIYSLSTIDDSSDALSTIEEVNEECSEKQIIVGIIEDSADSNTFSNTSLAMSEDSLTESIDSFPNNECQLQSRSSTDLESMDDSVADLKLSNSDINHVLGQSLENITKETDDTTKISYSDNWEVNGIREIGVESNFVESGDVLNGTLDNMNDFTPQNNSIPSNKKCMEDITEDALQSMDVLSPLHKYNSDLKRNNPAVGKICQSLGMAKAVEKWIQEITPAKAFMTCNESQNIVLFDELQEHEQNALNETNRLLEPESKNVESNPLAVSHNSVINGEGVASCPREINEDEFSCRSTLSDVDLDFETVPDKYDPLMFSKYYHLGINVDTPLSSGASSRYPSSNRSLEVSSQSPLTNEVDFQDNFYHSNKTDEVISSVPSSEKVINLYTQNSCSDMSTCNDLQERKGSCPKETECASLFSSGIGSSLASTPITSPSHLPPMRNEGGEATFPQTKQTDPHCAIL